MRHLTDSDINILARSSGSLTEIEQAIYLEGFNACRNTELESARTELNTFKERIEELTHDVLGLNANIKRLLKANHELIQTEMPLPKADQ